MLGIVEDVVGRARSTILPRYMTIMRLHIYATTPRLCVISMIDMPNSS